MDPLVAITLGLVQGLTEFLPISSSGHLVLAHEVLGGVGTFDLAFDALLHFATALAILLYFWSDFWRLAKTALAWAARKPIVPEDARVLLAIIVGTVPAAVLGFFLEEVMATIFRNPLLVAGTLVLGSAIMFAAERYGAQFEVKRPVGVREGLFIGLFQSLALVPGMSRSGMAISGGLFFGLSREFAARFAFMLGLPLLLGAGAKKALDLSASGVLYAEWLPIALGVISAFVTGLIAIHFMLRFLRSRSLLTFIFYRIALAALVLIVLL